MGLATSGCFFILFFFMSCVCGVVSKNLHRGIREESPREVRREKREGRIGKTAGQREQNEESREKSEERSEKRETSTIKMRGWKDAKVRSQNGEMVPKRFGP